MVTSCYDLGHISVHIQTVYGSVDMTDTTQS